MSKYFDDDTHQTQYRFFESTGVSTRPLGDRDTKQIPENCFVKLGRRINEYRVRDR